MAKLVPAILTDSPMELEKMLRAVEKMALAGQADEVHIDFMDGDFVETVSVPARSLIAANPKIDCEAHLMVKHPDAFVVHLKETRVTRVIFHIEAVESVDFMTHLFKEHGFSVGLGLNPETPVAAVVEHLADLDLVHFLTVHPGRQGNPFQPQVLDKIRSLRENWSSGTISVDGGIKTENIEEVAQSGADRIVVGSSLWQAADPATAFLALKQKL